jgi:hypothetical protein
MLKGRVGAEVSPERARRPLTSATLPHEIARSRARNMCVQDAQIAAHGEPYTRHRGHGRWMLCVLATSQTRDEKGELEQARTPP